MTAAVKYFNSTMSSAPALSNVAGSLLGVLDACLVHGFGSVTLDSLAVTDGVATATYGSGHGFAMTGNTGPVIRIEGATPSGLNGDWRVTVTSSSIFTFATSGIANQTATGTITAKRSPAGFEKAFSGTNKAAYRSLDVAGTRLYCRIDDTTTTYARIRGYEAMTDVNTGTGLFPTDAQISGGGYVAKATSSGSARPWRLYSDERMIYFFADPANNGSWAGGLVFGDLDSFVAADAFACIVFHSSSTSASYPAFYTMNANTNKALARTYAQTGGSTTGTHKSHAQTPLMGNGGVTYPSPANNGIYLWPVDFWEIGNVPRGLLPGVWCPLHNGDVPDNTLITDVPQLPGRTLINQQTGSSSYSGVIDLTGPWR